MLASIFLIGTFALSINGQHCWVQDDRCGERLYPRNNAARIHKGEDAGLGEFPWVISLQSSGYPGCSGSIINRNWILTDVSENDGVLEKDAGAESTVVIGTNNVNGDTKNPGRRYKNLKFYIHPNTDMALIRTEPMELNEDANAICLPPRNHFNATGWDLQLAGFGFSEPGLGYLRKKLEKITYSDDMRWYIGDYQVLSGGDSGSPGTFMQWWNNKWYQYGLVLWTSGGVRVSRTVDWIENTIAKADPNSCKHCERGWTQYKNKCFKLVTTEASQRKNYADSRDICRRDHGGDLITIHSEEEQIWVQEFLNRRIPKASWNFAWIGATGSSAAGFNWVDRSAMDYTNWDYNQPDNMGVAHAPANCASLLIDKDVGAPWAFGKWHDIECEYNHWLACQRVL